MDDQRTLVESIKKDGLTFSSKCEKSILILFSDYFIGSHFFFQKSFAVWVNQSLDLVSFGNFLEKYVFILREGFFRRSVENTSRVYLIFLFLSSSSQVIQRKGNLRNGTFFVCLYSKNCFPALYVLYVCIYRLKTDRPKRKGKNAKERERKSIHQDEIFRIPPWSEKG